MAESIDVNLPLSHNPRFPDRCVVCGHDTPGSHVRLITGTLGWWTWLTWWWGKPYVAKAPACAACAWKLHGLRLISLVLTISIALASVLLVWPHFKESVPPALRKWAKMGIALVCLLPQFIVELFFARPFDVTAFTDSVDFEFTSNEYAAEFVTLNMDAEWVKVNGELINELA